MPAIVGYKVSKTCEFASPGIFITFDTEYVVFDTGFSLHTNSDIFYSDAVEIK